jgi:hypothetical protein
MSRPGKGKIFPLEEQAAFSLGIVHAKSPAGGGELFVTMAALPNRHSFRKL